MRRMPGLTTHNVSSGPASQVEIGTGDHEPGHVAIGIRCANPAYELSLQIQDVHHALTGIRHKHALRTDRNRGQHRLRLQVGPGTDRLACGTEHRHVPTASDVDLLGNSGTGGGHRQTGRSLLERDRPEHLPCQAQPNHRLISGHQHRAIRAHGQRVRFLQSRVELRPLGDTRSVRAESRICSRRSS